VEGTRIIAISGLPQENLEQRALEAGCAEFYRKPIHPALLEQLLSGAPPLGGVAHKHET
jgi:CheY-like chemotaxis protein